MCGEAFRFSRSGGGAGLGDHLVSIPSGHRAGIVRD